MENTGQNSKQPTTPLARLRELGLRHRAGLGALLLIGAWFLLHLPGMGDYGLWDPWEMDRAHVARQMTDPPRVLVVEKREPGATLGPIARWLTLRYTDHLLVKTPDVAAQSGAAATVSKELDRAKALLEKEYFHIVVFDLAFPITDPRSHGQVRVLVEWLEQARARNPGTEFILTQPQKDSASERDAWAAHLRHTYTDARIELAARELTGRTWGQPGPFRRRLLTRLKAAQGDGYAVFEELTPPPKDSFLDQGFWRAADQRNLDAQMSRLVPAGVADELAKQSTFSLQDDFLPWPSEVVFADMLRTFASGEQPDLEIQQAREQVALSKASLESAESAARVDPDSETAQATLEESAENAAQAEQALSNAVASEQGLVSAAQLEAEIDQHYNLPWLRAQFKRTGETRSVPPLSYWLMALSFERLGFSEFACRFPGFLLGLLGLLLVYRQVTRIWGVRSGFLASAVLATSPLFFGQARSAAGEMTFTFGLLIIMLGFLAAIHHRDHEDARSNFSATLEALVLTLLGAAFCFLCQGVFGLLIPATIAISYTLVARERAPLILLLTAVLASTLAVLWVAVENSSEFHFLSHFTLENQLFNWNLAPDDRPIKLNFDLLVRQIGFGAAPWSALLPFAFGALFLDLVHGQEKRRFDGLAATGLLLILWFFVPYIVQSAVLKNSNHFVYPAIPAIAIAVGLLLNRLVNGRGMGALAGIVAAILLALLIKNTGKIAEPLTTYLTTDPPLVGEGDKSNYPEDLHLPSSVKYALLGIVALFMLHAARFATRIRLVIAFFTRPAPAAILLTIALVFTIARVLGGLEGHIASAFTTRTGQPLEAVHRLYVRSVFYWRPHSWALLTVFALSGLALIRNTSIPARFWQWLRTWVLTPLVARWLALAIAGSAAYIALNNQPDALEGIRDAGWAALLNIGIILGFSLIVFRCRGSVDTRMRSGAAFVIGLLVLLLSGTLAHWIEVVGFPIGLGLTIRGFIGLIGGIRWLRYKATTAHWLQGLSTPLAGWTVFGVGLAVCLCGLSAALPSAADHQPSPSTAAWIAIGLLILPLLFGSLRTILTSGVKLLRAAVQAIRLEGSNTAGGTLSLVCGLSSLIFIAVFGGIEEGALATVTFQSPLFWVLILSALLISTLGMDRSERNGPLLAGVGATFLFAALHLILITDNLLVFFGFVGDLPAEYAGERWTAIALVTYTVLSFGLLLNYCIGRFQRTTSAFFVLHGLGMMALLGLALEVLLREGTYADAAIIPWATYGSPLGVGTMIALAAWIAVTTLMHRAQKRQGDHSAGAPPRPHSALRSALSDPIVQIVVGAILAAIGLCGSIAQLFLESGLTMVDFLVVPEPRPAMAVVARNQGFAICGLAALSAATGTHMLWSNLRTSRKAAFLAFVASGVSVAIIMSVALVRKWLQLAPAIEAPGGDSFLVYLLLWPQDGAPWTPSRTTMLAYGLLLVAILIPVLHRLFGFLNRQLKPRLSHWKYGVQLQKIRPLRLAEALEKPRIFVFVLVLAAFSFSFFYNQSLVTALSFHVSQKHILDTVRDAEGGEVGDNLLFQHGLGESGGSHRNFYTRDIPEIKNAATALKTLAAQEDQVLTITRAGSSIADYRVSKGFDAANDSDNDGERDFTADAGIAESANPEERWIEDTTKQWAADQWVGYLLIDSGGYRYPITGNSASRIHYDPDQAESPPNLTARNTRRLRAPAFSTPINARNQYTVDHPDAPNHAATAMHVQRSYFLLPKVGDHAPDYTDRGSFSDLNHQFRELSDGQHLTVLDDRSSRILLATSQLRAGEESHNWLQQATRTESEFLAEVASGEIRGFDAENPLDGVIDWSGKMSFLGWRMDNHTVSKGKEYTVHLYFRCNTAMDTSYKLFLHMDRAGHRIHSDHWPLAVSQGAEPGKHCIGCFQTDHWLPGDIVVDTYSREVPYGAPSGETEIWLGWFNPKNDNRLPITGWDEGIVHYGGSDNRARVGAFVVR